MRQGKFFRLTVSVSGAGIVTSVPAGIRCPSTCSASFPQNTQVTLKESPDANNSFASWSGACSGSGACSLMLNSADSVTANFSGSGSGARVYVSGAMNNSGSQVYAFNAASNGQLTSVSGSPFSAAVGLQAGTSQFLFGTDHTNIFSFAVASDGSISQVSTINAEQYNNPANCGGGPDYLFLDRSGSTLYDLDLYSDCANNGYQSFGLNTMTGALTYLSLTSDVSPVFESALTFTGDNTFAFSASCYHYYQEIYGFARNSGGTLTLVTNLGQGASLPLAPGGNPYCPWLASADNANHLAISLTPMNGSTFQPSGPPVLGAFTVDDSGTPTTTNTSDNMPQVATTIVNDLRMSPDGKFLAVGGTGLQVFNFNGADPITQLTGLLITDTIDQLRWDANDNLYAIGNASGTLHIFNVSAAGAVQTQGSPYAVTSPQSLVVVPQS